MTAHRFAHAINFVMAADEPTACTTYKLKAVPGGTELPLISEALEGTKTARMSKSGQFIVDNMKTMVGTGLPTFGARLLLRMSPLVGLFTPASCRTGNWPLSRVLIEGRAKQ